MTRAIAAAVALLFTACGGAQPGTPQGTTDAGSSPGGGAGGGTGGGFSAGSGGGTGGSGSAGGSGSSAGSPGGAARPDGGTPIQPGTLTAGVWDDNENLDAFVAYRDALGQQAGLPPFTAEEQSDAHLASQLRSAKGSLDVALVIDTTGSMGDEIQYLQRELEALSTTLTARFPLVPQRWALVAYRDSGDEYVVRGWDFRSDLAQVRLDLQQLRPGGGGDFPEAADQALAHAGTLTWTSQARLVFWVADAPPHAAQAPALAQAVRALAAQGASVNPVASSGIDEVTEYTMRASAQRTGGRYLFLTDDSGVGGAHKEASVSCYHVTQLIYALERVVEAELTGQEPALDGARVLRAVGNPQAGVCTLASGATARAF